LLLRQNITPHFLFTTQFLKCLTYWTDFLEGNFSLVVKFTNCGTNMTAHNNLLCLKNETIRRRPQHERWNSKSYIRYMVTYKHRNIPLFHIMPLCYIYNVICNHWTEQDSNQTHLLGSFEFLKNQDDTQFLTVYN
jgi:hypothetical protein